MSRDDLRRLARLGAMRRIEELRREEAMLRSAFPELFDDRAPKVTRGAPASAPAAGKPGRRRRRRRSMSEEARKAVSERMKKYWAGRKRKARGKAKG